MKTKVFFLCLCFAAFLLSFRPAPADAAYRIYLKNGTVIEGIGSYRRTDKEITFLYSGGEVGIPLSGIKKIEEYTPSEGEAIKSEEAPEPAVTKPAPGKGPEAPSISPESQKLLNADLNRINGRLAQIQLDEDKYQKMKNDLQQIKLRIEVLFENGRSRAISAGKSPIEANQQYQQFLNPDERQWVQLNFIKKQQLEAQIKEMEDKVIGPEKSEKGRLLSQKRQIEAQLKGPQSGQPPAAP
ncbi:MAG: hypothetical protein M0Z59_06415 [Nitrospiraceae bacterium]|nr:hypothetical protein [Nitrospiraceae bacterium]